MKTKEEHLKDFDTLREQINIKNSIDDQPTPEVDANMKELRKNCNDLAAQYIQMTTLMNVLLVVMGGVLATLLLLITWDVLSFLLSLI